MWAAWAVQMNGLGWRCACRGRLDCGFEFGDAVEDAAADGVLGDQAEEALDLIDPGRRSRREVDVEARVALEPGFDRGVLVGGVVVDDQVQIERLGRFAIDGAQICRLPVTMPGHAFADDPPVATSSAANKVVVPWRL